MKRVDKGFLSKKNGKIRVNYKKTNSILLNQFIVDFLIEKKEYLNGYLLDAGCGEKPYSLIYDECCDKSIGCDVEYCIHDQKEVDVFASLDNLPFNDAKFDTVLCTNVLEHVANTEDAFAELARVLKPSGYAIIAIPFMYPLHEAPNDYYRFTTYGIKYQCEKNGLMVELLTPMGGVGMFVLVYINLIFGKFIKSSWINSLCCIIQRFTYYLYRKTVFNKVIKGGAERGISGIISSGYLVICKKKKEGMVNDG